MQRNNEVHWFLIWLLYSQKKLKMYLEHSSGQLKLFNAFMNQTNKLLVWFMIYNFKVNYSMDNFFFPIIWKGTTKRNIERRWETILINSRQSKKKKENYPCTWVWELRYQAFIYYNFNLSKSIYYNFNLPKSIQNKKREYPCEFGELTKLGYQSA